MNVSLYIDEFERSVRNLPVVISRWEEFSETVRRHLADEFALMMLRQDEALDASLGSDNYWDVASRISALNADVLILYGADLARLFGVRARDLVGLAVSSVSLSDDGSPFGALASVPPARGEPLALAA